MTVQGILRDADGVPVEELTTFRFELLDGTRVAWTEEHSVTPRAGLFTITLGAGTPIDPAWFAAPLSLRLAVEGEAMDPIPLTSVPYAFRANTVDRYDGDVSWGQISDLPPDFADGTDDGNTYLAGTGLTLDGSTFSVSPEVVQSRVSASCPAGQSIRAIAQDGTVMCEVDDVGPPGTTYTAGSGLTLTGTQFDVDTSLIQARVSGTCPAGQAIRAIGVGGTVTCEPDADTTYSAAAGLTLTGTAFSVDTSAIQARVSSSCAAGSSIRAIAADGTVICEIDDDTGTTYSAGPGLTLTGTTFAVDASAVQVRVAGTCPAGSSIRAIAADGTVVCEIDDDTDTDTTYAAGTGLTLTGTTFAVDSAAVQARVSGACGAGQAIQSIAADGSVTCGAAGDPTPDTIADDGVISDAEASDNLSIANGLLIAPAGGTLVDVNGELRSDGIRLVGTGAPTTYEVSMRRYVVDSTPATVGRVIPLDSTLVDALCRDIDGCNVTVSMINWDASGQPGNVASRQERLFISATSRWWRFANNDVAGFDGTTVQEWQPWDCYFGDAETYTGTTNGRADATAGFGLLNVAGGTYSDATVTCRVTIED
jgi:hypothetical protein